MKKKTLQETITIGYPTVWERLNGIEGSTRESTTFHPRSLPRGRRKLLQQSMTKGKGIYSRNGIFWLAFTVDGKQRHKSLQTRDYGEAVVKAEEIRKRPALVKIGRWVDDMGIYFDTRQERETMSDKTIISTSEVITQFFFFCKKETAKEVTKEDAENWFDELNRRKLTRATAQTYRARLSAFFKFLKELGKMDTDPLQNIGVKKVPPHALARNKVLEVDTIKMIFNDLETKANEVTAGNEVTADKEKINRLRFVLFCGFHAGMRKTEIIMTRPHWFNVPGHSIHIPHEETTDKKYYFRTKNAKARVVPLSKEFREFLEKEYLFRPEQLFCLPTGKGIRYRWDFRRPLNEYFQSRKIHLNAHAMRHSFSAACLQADVSISKVAAWLGDRTRTVETFYANFLPKRGELDEVF